MSNLVPRSLYGIVLLTAFVLPTQLSEADEPEPGATPTANAASALSAPKEGEKDTASEPKLPSVCPLYEYINHGEYTTYYAVYETGCGPPLMWDGPPGVATTCGGSCFGFRERHQEKRHAVRHETENGLATNGIGRPASTNLNQDWIDLKNTGVNHVKFRKNSRDIYARVYLVELDPLRHPDHDPRYGVAKMTAGVGYQVPSADITADRAYDHPDHPEVFLVSEGSYQATIVVELRDGEWREYNIILRNPSP